MISVKKLRKEYGPIVAVHGISFEVAKGEVVGFLGPNGAGKTTTIKMLTCYMAPTSGTASVAGHDILAEPLAVRQAIGYLPENAPLYGDMRVFEYLKWVGEIRGYRKDELTHRVRRAIDLCALERVVSRLIGELSKGYRQRVGLAHALLHDPDVLILDEPWSGLDPNQIVESRDLIRRIGENKTVVLSTHILSEVEATCSRAIIVNNGEICADASPRDLRGNAANDARILVKLDIGSADLTSDEVLARLRELRGVREARVRQATNVEGGSASRRVIDLEVAPSQANGDGDVRGVIVERALAESWRLLEIRHELPTLEDVFRRLTGARSAPTLHG